MRRARSISDAADVLAIIQVQNLYAFALDFQDWDLFRELVMPDVVAEYPRGESWRDVESWIADFAPRHAGFLATRHVMTNHVVTVRGDTAKATCYGTVYLLLDTSPRQFVESRPHYEDELVSEDGLWRISKRICRSVGRSLRELGESDAALLSLKGHRHIDL